MNKKVCLLFVLIGCTLLTSCYTVGIVGTVNYKLDKKYFIGAEVFHTLSDHQALAFDDEGVVVSIIDNKNVLYDGKMIMGTFTMSGTYSFNDDGYQRTVPLLVRNGRKKEVTSTLPTTGYDLR